LNIQKTFKKTSFLDFQQNNVMKYGTSLGDAGSPMTGKGILSTKKRESVFSDARMSMPGGSFYTSGEGESPVPVTTGKG
jgi:hypothetical protein